MQKREALDYKDRDYDSDDDVRKEMMTFDDRLTFINNVDRKLFGKDKEEVQNPVKEEKKEGEVDEELD